MSSTCSCCEQRHASDGCQQRSGAAPDRGNPEEVSLISNCREHDTFPELLSFSSFGLPAQWIGLWLTCLLPCTRCQHPHILWLCRCAACAKQNRNQSTCVRRQSQDRADLLQVPDGLLPQAIHLKAPLCILLQLQGLGLGARPCTARTASLQLAATA